MLDPPTIRDMRLCQRGQNKSTTIDKCEIARITRIVLQPCLISMLFYALKGLDHIYSFSIFAITAMDVSSMCQVNKVNVQKRNIEKNKSQ